MIKVLVRIAKQKIHNIAATGGMLGTILVLSTSIAHADWRRDIGIFRIGIASNAGVPVRSAELEEFRAAISDALNMPVEIFQARDASSLIDAAASSRIEYSILSALGFATLDLTCECAVPIAAPISAKGATAVRSVLFVNSKAITSLQDLAGKRVAIGPESSLTNSILPMKQFKFNGIDLRDADIKLVRADSVEGALEALNDGRVDAFFGWDHVIPKSEKFFSSSLSQKIESYADLETSILWVSQPVRFGPHTIRKNMPQEAIDALQKTLVSLNDKVPLAFDAISPNLAGGLVAVDYEEYRTAISLVRSLEDTEKIDSAVD